MRGDVHVRFVERPGETGRPRGRNRAPGRLDDHTALMGRVRHRIRDKRDLGWVKAFLRDRILTRRGPEPRDDHRHTQGGILSPLLANIALSVLDEHFAARWAALGSSWELRSYDRLVHDRLRGQYDGP
jgi:hypothetical protein